MKYFTFMDILRPKTIEDYIGKELIKGEIGTVRLLEVINKIVPGTTKQGYYYALRKLIKDEVIVIYKKKVSLHSSWLTQLQEITSVLSSNLDYKDIGISSIEELDKASYIFSSVLQLDSFWGHWQNICLARTLPSEPVYSFDPHYWFYIAREQSEKILIENITKQKRQFLMTVGDNVPLDKIIKKDLQGEMVQCDLNPDLNKRNDYYYTIVGNYLTEVWLDKEATKTIETVFQSAVDINPKIIKDLQNIFTLKGRYKIKISHNPTKAEMLKKRLSKNFHILHNNTASLQD